MQIRLASCFILNVATITFQIRFCIFVRVPIYFFFTLEIDNPGDAKASLDDEISCSPRYTVTNQKLILKNINDIIVIIASFKGMMIHIFVFVFLKKFLLCGVFFYKYSNLL